MAGYNILALANSSNPFHQFGAAYDHITSLLIQEIKRERAKGAAAINAVQEKMEETLRVELEQKVCI